jgi:molecular chaperone HtpG
MKEAIGKVSAVKWNASLSEHPVCLSSEGELSIEMAKILKKMPGADEGIPNASVVLEINMNHAIASKLESLYENDKDTLAKYAKILY